MTLTNAKQTPSALNNNQAMPFHAMPLNAKTMHFMLQTPFIQYASETDPRKCNSISQSHANSIPCHHHIAIHLVILPSISSHPLTKSISLSLSHSQSLPLSPTPPLLLFFVFFFSF
jgi:hypothetical protein